MKRYAEVREQMVGGVRTYAEDVRARRFPAEEHSYTIPPEELEDFRRYLEQESLVRTDTPWDW